MTGLLFEQRALGDISQDVARVIRGNDKQVNKGTLFYLFQNN